MVSGCGTVVADCRWAIEHLLNDAAGVGPEVTREYFLAHDPKGPTSRTLSSAGWTGGRTVGG